MNAGSLFTLAWRVVPRLPGPVVRAVFDLVARVAHVLRIDGVRQLEANLARVLRQPPSPRALRRLSRDGMRSYMRYYGEAFQLPGLTADQIAHRVRNDGAEEVLQHLAEHRSVIAALSHSGNWDVAGAWFVQQHGSVVTVAETLEPEELFREFLAFREGLGMTVVPFAKGTGVFRRLITEARRQDALVPLLADRDLSRDGIEVQFAGHPMRVAPGPAALALVTGLPLVPIHVRYERLHGDRRRRAGTPWGTVITFLDTIEVPDLPREQAIAAMTQAWVDAMVVQIRRYPQDWHMLQKVFTADLDRDRLARAHERQAPGGAA
jgi:lauroyl/myristoyl acyltransferase